jgi:1-acyl-sn-glycerol-3-phosphate acyltransferase
MAPVRLGRRIAAPSVKQVPRTVAAALDLVVRPSVELRKAFASGGPPGLDAAFAQWGSRVVRDLGIDLRVEGLENIDPAGAYVVVALHEGFIDVPILARLPIRPVFTARSELLEWPTLGRFLRATQQIVVSDESGIAAARALLEDGSSRLRLGRSVVIFPQGSILGIETDFQNGAPVLARRAGIRILPVVLAGTHRVWEHPFSPTVRFGQPVFVSVLPPIYPDQWHGLQARMKEAALSNTHAPVRRFNPDRDGWWDGYRFSIDPTFTELAGRHLAHLDRIRRSGPVVT